MSGFPRCASFPSLSFFVLHVSLFSWMLSAWDYNADPAVLFWRDVAAAYFNTKAPGSGCGWDTCVLGTGSATANAGRHGWARWFLPGDRERQDREPATRKAGHRHVKWKAAVNSGSL